MKKHLFRIWHYITHFMSSRNNYGHGIHSPYIFNFVQSTLHCEHAYYCFNKIENIRKQNASNKSEVHITDFGTGNNRISTVAKITNTALQSKKNAQLLFKIANYIKAENILELGTSLGITTAYLVSHSSKCNCISFEGAEEIVQIAKKNHNILGIRNIKIINGDINKTLAKSIAAYTTFDLIYIDANHNYASLMQYYEEILNKTHENSVVVIDDIYWSDGMRKAWEEIKNHPATTCTIDIYHMGIVFYKPFLHKENFKIVF